MLLSMALRIHEQLMMAVWHASGPVRCTAMLRQASCISHPLGTMPGAALLTASPKPRHTEHLPGPMAGYIAHSRLKSTPEASESWAEVHKHTWGVYNMVELPQQVSQSYLSCRRAGWQPPG